MCLILSTSKAHPVKVIDFLLIGHLEPPIKLVDLNSEGVFTGHPPPVDVLSTAFTLRTGATTDVVWL